MPVKDKSMVKYIGKYNIGIASPSQSSMQVPSASLHFIWQSFIAGEMRGTFCYHVWWLDEDELLLQFKSVYAEMPANGRMAR